jgi:DNA polymerase I-like protein with 3'-5' exonuclease and polymerase domains
MSDDWRPPDQLPDLRHVGIVALDLETRDDALAADHGSGWATHQGYVCGINIAYRADGALHSLYIPIRHPDTENLPAEQVYAWLKDHVASDLRFVTQNGLYDWGWLRTEGDVPMPPGARLEEIGALATLVDENRHRYSLDALCKWRGLPGKDETLLREGVAALGLVENKRKKLKPQNHIWQLPARYVGPYAEADATSTLRLFEELNPILDQENTRGAYRLECELLPMVLEMRRRGVRIDVAAAERARDFFLSKRDAALAEISAKLGVPVTMHELARNKWLAESFDREGIKYPRTEKGNPSFTGGQKGWMDRHPHWLPQLVWTANKYNTAGANFIDSYILDYVVNGRVHAEIHPHRSEANGTKSFRFSYSDPPLQLMSARDEELTPLIRGLFLPEEGEVWTKPDASQQEFRFAVHYAVHHKVPKADLALKRYLDDPDTDFHAFAGQITGLDRKHAKNVNFAKIYGAGVKKFAIMIGKPLNEASAIYEQYDRELPFLRRLSEIYQGIARRQGYVTLYDGARRRFNEWAPGGKWEKGAGPCERAEAERRLADPNHPWFGRGPLYRADTRNALNALIQGSAARHTKLWMRAVWREGIVPLLQMHDALECSVATREQAEMVAQLCVDAINLKIPMRVDLKFGRNWGDAKHTWEELHGAPASEPVQCNESPAHVSPESVPVPEQPALHIAEAETSTPPPPALPPPSARAKQTDDRYRRGEDGGTAEDFDFSADLIWPGVSNGGAAVGASAKTNGGAQSNASSRGTSRGPSSGRVSYIYRSSTGTPFMKVVRTPAKTFPTYHWTGNGWAKGWPATVLPYRLPELHAAPADTIILICEGEKDANTAIAHGFLATTNPGGAGKWQPELSQYFQNKQRVCIMQDNDQAGRGHSALVSTNLRTTVPTIGIVAFPELPPKGDLTDFFMRGGTAQALQIRIDEALQRGVARPYILRNLATVTPQHVQWLWPYYLACGHLELLTGEPGLGKSQLQCVYIACVTTGRAWPDGTPGLPQPGCVLMLTAEDQMEDTTVPRLIAAGADLNRIEELKCVRRNDRDEMFLLSSDIATLGNILADHPNFGLVTIDPITAYMGSGKGFDSHRATDVRSQLAPLKDLSGQYRVAISAVTHPPKNVGQNPLNMFIGSQAYIAAARIGHLCLPEYEDGVHGARRQTGLVWFTTPKLTLGAKNSAGTLTYRVETRLIDSNGEQIETSAIKWLGPADMTAEEAMGQARQSARRGSPVQEFVRGILANGPVLQKVVVEKGEAAGFSLDQLKRARKAIDAVSFKRSGANLSSPWLWSLREHMPADAEPES